MKNHIVLLFIILWGVSGCFDSQNQSQNSNTINTIAQSAPLESPPTPFPFDTSAERTLEKGWELVAFPVNQATAASEVFETNTMRNIWGWDAPNKKWQVYPNTDFPEFSELAEVFPERGYWIRVIEPFEFQVDVTHIPPPYQITQGWNLLGIPDAGINQSPEAFFETGNYWADSCIEGNPINSVFAWKDNRWEVWPSTFNEQYGTQFPLLTQLESGIGFWLNANQSNEAASESCETPDQEFTPITDYSKADRINPIGHFTIETFCGGNKTCYKQVLHWGLDSSNFDPNLPTTLYVMQHGSGGYLFDDPPTCGITPLTGTPYQGLCETDASGNLTHLADWKTHYVPMDKPLCEFYMSKTVSKYRNRVARIQKAFAGKTNMVFFLPDRYNIVVQDRPFVADSVICEAIPDDILTQTPLTNYDPDTVNQFTNLLFLENYWNEAEDGAVGHTFLDSFYSGDAGVQQIPDNTRPRYTREFGAFDILAWYRHMRTNHADLFSGDIHIALSGYSDGGATTRYQVSPPSRYPSDGENNLNVRTFLANSFQKLDSAINLPTDDPYTFETAYLAALPNLLGGDFYADLKMVTSNYGGCALHGYLGKNTDLAAGEVDDRGRTLTGWKVKSGEKYLVGIGAEDSLYTPTCDDLIQDATTNSTGEAFVYSAQGSNGTPFQVHILEGAGHSFDWDDLDLCNVRDYLSHEITLLGYELELPNWSPVKFPEDFDDACVGNHLFANSKTPEDPNDPSDPNKPNDPNAPEDSEVFQIRILDPYDDAEEDTNGNLSTGSTDLEMVEDGSPQMIGLRFTNIAIPKNSEIVSAYIQFQSDETDADATSLNFAIEATDDARAFGSDDKISSRTWLTSPSISWEPAAWHTQGEAGPDQRTPNLAELLQQVVNRPQWDMGNSIAFKISGSGKRVALSYNGDSNGAPLLQVVYVPYVDEVSPSTPLGLAISHVGAVSIDLAWNASTDDIGVSGYSIYRDNVLWATASSLEFRDTVFPGTSYDYRIVAFDAAGNMSAQSDVLLITTPSTIPPFSSSVSESYRDAEEKIDGDMIRTSDDLDLGRYTTGLIFSMDVPKNAIIESAYVQFTAANSDDEASDFSIHLQDTVHATSFTNDDGNITNRISSNSTPIPWSPEAWVSGEAGLAQQTPDLKTLVQHIVNKADWVTGNNIGLVITGTGDRAAVSFDDGNATPAALHIQYTVPTDSEAPTTPTNLSTTHVWANAVDLQWDTAQDNLGIKGYEIYENGTLKKRSFSSETSLRMTVEPNTSYTYTVVAFDDWNNKSAPSNAIQITTPSNEEKLETNLIKILSYREDVEENVQDGDVNRASQTLNLGEEKIIGLRYRLFIPKNATIEKALLQFTPKATNSASAQFQIYLSEVGNAPAFSTDDNDVSQRLTETVGNPIAWTPAAWYEDLVVLQQPPDLKDLIQAIVNRSDWKSQQHITILITGSGEREAESFDSDPQKAPNLIIEYVSPVDSEPPTIPSNVTATHIGGDQITLTWTSSQDNFGVARYYIFRNGEKLSEEAATTSFSDQTVASNQTYSYQIIAVDTAGNESNPSQVITVTTPAPNEEDTEPPTTPSNLNAINVEATVQLSWNASTDNVSVSGYYIYRDGSSNSIGSSTSTSFTDPTVASSTTYVYRISAFDAADNESNLSDSITITTLSADNLPITVTRGPYLQKVSSSSITLGWRTSVASDSVVHYGTDPNALNQTRNNNATVSDHWVTLDGLTPSTKYYYAIGKTGAVLAGNDSEHFFVMSPTIGSETPTRIWVLGDSGTANSNAAAVRDAYLDKLETHGKADLMLMLGDNAYDDGTDAEYQAAVFDMYPSILRNTPLWSTLGNHDAYSLDSEGNGPYYDIFELPKNGEAGGIASGTEAYYSFDYGNIHFIVLDSQDSDTATDGPMLTWLQNDVVSTLQHWIIAFWHHPPYSKGSHDSDSESKLMRMRENALPILEAAGVDLVLTGHSHSYERSFLIDGHYGLSSTFSESLHVKDLGTGQADSTGMYIKGETANDGSVYVVAGSSGKLSSKGNLDHPVMKTSLRELGSMILDIDGDRMDTYFLNASGEISDYFTLVKSNEADENSAPVADFTVSSTEVTVDQSLDFVSTSTDLDGAIAETRWDFGDGATATGSSVSHTYTTSGIYTIELTVKDNAPIYAKSNTTSRLVTVRNSDGTFDTVSSVTLGTDDAEETEENGSIARASIDLDMGEGNLVGIRFADLQVPQYAMITDAYVQFKASSSDSAETTLNAYWENTADAQTFSTSSHNISDRFSGAIGPTAWSPSDWAKNEAGTDQQLTGIESSLQQLITHPFWKQGNAAVLLIEGTGERAAYSFDEDDSDAAPATLHIRYRDYDGTGDVTAPTVPTSVGASGVTNYSLRLDWAATDDYGIVSQYRIYRDGMLVGTSHIPFFLVTGLSAGQTYTFQISAEDPSGNRSALSTAISATTTNAPPPGGVSFDGNFNHWPTPTGLVGSPYGSRSLPDSFTEITELYRFQGSPITVYETNGDLGLGFTEDNVGERKHDFHPGIDLPIDPSDPIVAVESGIVEIAGTHPDVVGGIIKICHGVNEKGREVCTVYRHINPNTVPTAIQTGASVNAGDLLSIGWDGISATWAHLHFETRERTYGSSGSQNSAVNPMKYFSSLPNTTPVEADFIGFVDIGTNERRMEIKISDQGDQLDLLRFKVVLSDADTNTIQAEFHLDKHQWIQNYTFEKLDALNFNPSNVVLPFDRVVVTPVRFSNDGSSNNSTSFRTIYYAFETEFPQNSVVKLITVDVFGNILERLLTFNLNTVDSNSNGVPDTNGYTQTDNTYQVEDPDVAIIE